jgi:molybdenum cofactor cytidylyltransferase
MKRACVILAAGKSQRFGSPKMRYRLPSGRTLLEETINRYRQQFDVLTVVLNGADDDWQSEQNLFAQNAVNIEFCEQADQGMSQSLITAVRRHIETDAMMIALGDMPYVSAHTVEQLKASMSAEHIVVPRYQGKSGNPVSFGKRFYLELLQVSGDQGGKSVITAHPEAVTLVDVDDPGIRHDIDTPEHVLPE